MAKIKKEMEESQKAQSAMERRSSELAAKVEKLSISLNEQAEGQIGGIQDGFENQGGGGEERSGSKSVAAKDAEFEKRVRDSKMELEVEKRGAAAAAKFTRQSKSLKS